MAPCAPTVDCAECTVMNSATQKSEQQSQRSPDCPMWHQTVRCSKTIRRPNGQLLWTLMVALTWRAQDSAQWLSGAPIASRIQSTARSGWEAINTTNHLIYFHPSLPKSSFIARAKAQHSKTQSKQSIHSKSPKSTLVHWGLWEDQLCFLLLLSLGLAFSFSLLILKRLVIKARDT
jgi:hypothetical protein